MIKFLQFSTAIIIAGFVFMHLSTHMTSNLGPQVYNQLLAELGKYYRYNIYVEGVLLGAIAVHVLVGLLVFVGRLFSCCGKKAQKPADPKAADLTGGFFSFIHPLRSRRAHVLAGLFLAMMVGGHVFMERVLPTILKFTLGYSHVAAGFLAKPALPFIFTFYLWAAMYHTMSGILIMIRKDSFKQTGVWSSFVVLSLALSVAMVLGFTQHGDPKFIELAQADLAKADKYMETMMA